MGCSGAEKVAGSECSREDCPEDWLYVPVTFYHDKMYNTCNRCIDNTPLSFYQYSITVKDVSL